MKDRLEDMIVMLEYKHLLKACIKIRLQM